MSGSALLRQPRLPDPAAQQRAASDPAASVWVNASAGSGKTTILTKRVTRLLLAGVKPQRILCLTFTRAAAAEMALRVTGKLSQWAVCTDNELSTDLADLEGRPPTPKEMTRARRLFAEALACPGGMRIRTLHAFGQEVLRRFPIESGLPPHFAVIEEEDARTLQDEVLTGLLRDAAANPDTPMAKALAHLIAALGEKAFREAARLLLREKERLAQAVAKHSNLDTLITHLHSALDLATDDSEDSLLQSAFAASVFPEANLHAAAKILAQGTINFAKRGNAILSWLEKNAEQRIASFNTYESCFFNQDGSLPKNPYAAKDMMAKHPGLEDFLRREATRLQILAERRDAAATAATTAAALTFGSALIERYSNRKREQAALDYDDLVIETLHLLQRPGIAPWVLHKLDDGLDHLLVDEAQDTSRAQWDIVATLADEFFAGTTAQNNNRTLFVVGDEKQSIYSFQNADPEAFADMRGFFKSKIEAAKKSCHEIPLHVSFRSAPAILRAVDAVFSSPEAAAGVSAVPVEHSSFKAGKLFGRVELWPLLPQPEIKKATSQVWELPIGYEGEHDPQAEMADRIATTIKGWLAKSEELPGAERPIRPGDIMILLRKRGRFADLMVRALKKKPHDVPVTGVDRMHLIEQLPVMDLLAVIQFMLLPEDNLNLATVLRGPLVNLSEDNLMTLAMKRGDITLWQGLKNAATITSLPLAGGIEGGLVNLSAKLDQPTPNPSHKREGDFMAAYEYLASWLNKADFMSPFTLLAQILNEPCPGSNISGRRALWSRLSLDALDPIEELLNAAQNFSRRHAPSLQKFLQWLTASDSEIKRELDNGNGQVRIMTVHASKGLEAPIVFLPDTASVPRVQDVPKFLWNAQGLPFYLAHKPHSGAMGHLWNVARTKQMGEYRRLLYVAMTRTSHRLYVGGWELKKKETDSEGCWHNLVKDGLKQSESGVQADGGIIVWEDPALRDAAKPSTVSIPAPLPALPAWAFRPAPVEKVEMQALAPSQIANAPSAATPDQAFARGRIIHRLLQSLPDLDDARRDDAATRFLAHPQHALDDAQQQDVHKEVLQLLRTPKFAPLFGATSRAEVPIAGVIDNRKISGQVDRLALLDDEVWIIDYKTNRPPPTDASNIPTAYHAQMSAYRAVLQAVYPGRNVRCFLLWTYGARLMEVPLEA